MTNYEKLQIIRKKDRVTLKPIINKLFTDLIELKGDGNYQEDSAIYCGIGKLDNQVVTVIGNDKGQELEEKMQNNFGMSNPEGYKKALKHIKRAEKFNQPVITFIDTAGASPGIESEERGIGKAIANMLYELSDLKVPIISVVISEGGSGGALAIGVNDYCICFENAYFSVISPEGYAAIMYKGQKTVEEAVEEMPIFSEDLIDLKIVDQIIKEREFNQEFFEDLKKQLLIIIDKLQQLPAEELVNKRINKYLKY